jgi:uncharacterized protein (DUF488 family)
MPDRLATIGYEGAPLAGVLDRLLGAGVDLLIDVRAVASSRRAGFSKTLLAASLEEAGIGYRHLRDLGTPKPGRVAARAGRTEEMRRIFEAHLLTTAAALALEEAAALSGTRRACLLCFEEDWRCCHRAIVADRLHERSGIPVVHL